MAVWVARIGLSACSVPVGVSSRMDTADVWGADYHGGHHRVHERGGSPDRGDCRYLWPSWATSS